MRRTNRLTIASFLMCTMVLAACGNGDNQVDLGGNKDRPSLILETQADSVAMQVVNALGGLDAWNEIPYVRFDFAVESPNRSMRRHHFWDKVSGDYRLQYPSGMDSTTVVLFNTDSRDGKAFINNVEVEGDEGRDLVARAHRTFINDTYWMLAPLKLFDDGVTRELGDPAETGDTVLTLQFDSVGYTPGDRYWITVDDSTGRVSTWEYVLQGESAHRGLWSWEDYRAIESPAGTLTLAETRASRLSESRIYTDNISFPATVDPAMFSDPSASME